MPDIRDLKDVGEIVATREMEFVYDEGHREAAGIRVGKPREWDGAETWVCPYEVWSESYQKIFGMVGIDAIQSLELTMKTLRAEIEHWERKWKGKFFFLDEEGAGI